MNQTVVASKQGLEGEHSINSFIVASHGEADEDIVIVRLNFAQDKHQWKVVLKRNESAGSGSFVNIFHLKGDQVLLLRKHHIITLSKAFEVLTTTNV